VAGQPAILSYDGLHFLAYFLVVWVSSSQPTFCELRTNRVKTSRANPFCHL